MRRELRAIADTVAFADSPPPTLALLRRRATRDAEAMVQLLRGRGYFAASAESILEPQEDRTRVVFRVQTGPQFTLSSIGFELEEQQEEIMLPRPEEVGLEPGLPAEASRIIDAETEILYHIGSQGYPSPSISDRQVVVDHKTHTVEVVYRIDPGPKQNFGEVEVLGLRSLDPRFVRNLVPWEKGDPYDISQVETFRNRLASYGLFSMIRILRRGNGQDDVPVTVQLRESRHRSISAGVGYATEEGFSVRGSWEHRNLFGAAERLRLGIEVSEISYGADAMFRKPQFLIPRQTLQLDFRVFREEPEAYESRTINSSAMIERRVTERLRMAAGPALRYTRVDQLDEEDDFLLVSFPGSANWDSTDSLLDPRRGARVFGLVEPFFDLLTADRGFVKALAGYRHYIEVIDDPSVTIAARAMAGSISAATVNRVPADLRFYAGGGGSIRGYAFQKVGPLEGDEPIGGLSLIEASLEVRTVLTERFGLTLFLDGGSAFADRFPDDEEDLLWGAGLGIRYFTLIGPIRADIGFPLERRSGIDDRYQVYVSIGQAF